VLIMTSNHRGDLQTAFKPEFINRIDEIVNFRSLTEDDITEIVDIQLRGLDKRLEARRLGLVITDDAKRWLAHRGYDPVYGARPLKRLIQRQISDRLALALLEGKYAEGSTVTVDVGPPVVGTEHPEAFEGLILS
jgi:ATP-dependent Clp protease ATP-binding subunit ClpB